MVRFWDALQAFSLFRFDGYLSLADWVWLGIKLLTDGTGASVTAYFLTQLDWYRQSLQWAGLAVGAIVACPEQRGMRLVRHSDGGCGGEARC